MEGGSASSYRQVKLVTEESKQQPKMRVLTVSKEGAFFYTLEEG
jgi:uncharacterized protein with WD repeat